MKFGLVLDEEYTTKLYALAEYNETSPYELLINAIDTMAAVLEMDE